MSSFHWEIHMNCERSTMFQRQRFGWAFTIVLLSSSLRAQEAVIGSKGGFAGEPTPAKHILTGHKYPVHAVAISPDMKTIVSGGGEIKLPFSGKPGQKLTINVKDAAETARGEGLIWDVKTAKRRSLLQPPPGRISGLSFNHDGKVLGGYIEKSPLAGNQSQIPTVGFWDAKTGKAAKQYLGLNAPKALSFSEDGKVVVVAGGFRDPDLITTGPLGQNALVKNPKHGNVIRLLQYPAMTVRQQIDIEAKSLDVALYADSHFVAYNVDQAVHVFAVETGKERVVIPNAPFGNMQISPDGKVLAILGEQISQKHALQLFSLETGAAIGAPAFVDSTWSRAFAFSPDSQQLAIATGWADNEALICLWSIAERKELARFVGHQVYSLAFARDGSFLVSGSLDKTVRIWKLPSE
jgi:WD40 repeat protein